jgi:hypothetical protein
MVLGGQFGITVSLDMHSVNFKYSEKTAILWLYKPSNLTGKEYALNRAAI